MNGNLPRFLCFNSLRFKGPWSIGTKVEARVAVNLSNICSIQLCYFISAGAGEITTL